MSGKLHVIATPIGNLGDITFRAIETLKNVDLIAAEDTRSAGVLLSHYGIRKPLTSFFEANEKRKKDELLSRLKSGETIALISEAGTPTISDPGYRLISGCVLEGIEVVSVPGACALISALSISGLPTDSFLFEGFLPPKSSGRLKKMRGWENEARTVIYYESPYRVLKSIEDLKSVFGDISIVLARELTKRFEEVLRGRISQILEHYTGRKVKGEFVVLLNLRMQVKEVQ